MKKLHAAIFSTLLALAAGFTFSQTSYFDSGDPIDKGHVYDEAPLYSAFDPFGIGLLTNLEARINALTSFSDEERDALRAYADNTASTNAAAARTYAYGLTLPLSASITSVGGRVTVLETLLSGGIVTSAGLAASEAALRGYADAAAAAALSSAITNTEASVAAAVDDMRGYSDLAAASALSSSLTGTAAAVAAADTALRAYSGGLVAASETRLQNQIDALPTSTNQLTQLLNSVASSALAGSATNLDFLAAVGTNVVVTKLQEDPVSWFSVRTAGDDLIARVQVVLSSMMVWTAVFNPGVMDSGTSEFIDTAPKVSPYFNRPPEYAYFNMSEYGSVLFYLADAQNNLEFYSPTNVFRISCVAGSLMKPVLDVYDAEVPQGATCFTNYCRLNNGGGTNSVYAVFTAAPVSTFAVTNAVTLNTYVSRMLEPVAESLAESSSGFTNSFVSLSNGLTAANESISNSFAAAAALVTQETSRVAAVMTQHVASVSSGITGLVSAVSNDLSVLAGVVVSNSGAIAALSGIVVSNSDYAVQLASNITAVSSNLTGASVALTNHVAGVADGLTNLITSTEDKLVPTNRTITVNGQTGTLDEDVVLNIDAGVTEPTVTNIAQAVVDANVPTLAEAANSGGFAGTETITPLNIVMGGYWQALSGVGTSTIDSSARGASQSGYNNGGSQTIGDNAYGASQSGYNNGGSQAIGSAAYGASQSGYNDGGSQTIGGDAYGASQSGYNDGSQTIGDNAFGASQSGCNGGSQTIGSAAYGASQSGYNYGSQTIGSVAFGASQSGYNYGSQTIGDYAFGSMQRGSLSYNSSATNNASGAIQIYSLSEGQHALTTTDGAASLLIGAGTISNKNTIVVGDNEYSHGQGSVTAGGGFFGSGIGITINGTNIQDAISQRVEKSNGAATNLSVFSSLTLFDKTITWNTSRQTFDVPLYGGVVGQLFQENLMLVRNQTGANIGNGKIVCSAGSVGDNSAIRKASNADASCAWGVLGMVTQDAGIDHGSDGLICTGGEVNNLPLPTSIYQPSNTLWLATDGNYTNVEPQNVAVKYQIGTVLRAHATEGRIQFHPQFIPSPETLGALPTSHNSDETAHPDIRSLIDDAKSISRKINTSAETIVIYETNVIYKVSVSSPNNISNDLSHIVFDGVTEKKWELWVNYLTTNSLSTQWDSRMDFGGYTPDLTVTGQYKFACSTVDGITINAKQIYPTVYEWRDGEIGQSVANSTMGGTYGQVSLGTGVTNHFRIIAPFCNSLLIYKQFINFSITAQNLELTLATTDYVNNNEQLLKTTGKTDFVANNRYTLSVAFTNSGTSASYSMTDSRIIRLYFAKESLGTGGNMYISRPKIKCANELEIKAYNAGWRP